jgi:hypothetical protein
LTIKGSYQMTASSQILAEPLLLLHFKLISISPRGNPARTASEMLQGYLLEGSFDYREIEFDLTTDALTLKHASYMAKLIETLQP